MGHYRNLVEPHRYLAARLGQRPALRWKQWGIWRPLSWADYRERALACAAALVDVGIQPGDRVGLLAENSVDWLIADMGIMTAGAVNVPPHAPLTAKQIHFQLQDAGVRWLFVSSAEQRDKLQSIRSDLPDMRGLVVFDRSAANEQALSWPGFLQRGRQVLPRWQEELACREQQLTASSLATIMYTSGTTGNPKGVMLTQGNLLSNAEAVNQLCRPAPDSLVLSWLPFSHIYARTVDHYVNLIGGITVCLAEAPETLVQDLAEIEPTHMSNVPRFYEKLLAAVGSADPQTTTKRLRNLFGRRISWLGAGGAPLPLSLGKVLQDAGLPIYPGYGLTESAPVITTNYPGHCKLGTAGPAIPGVEVKIAGDGEILTRGPHVMAGYWNNPQATAETVRDGWLHTGDLGHLDADGFLTITGRKKELLVLSNGKKVVPTYIEGLLAADPHMDQAVVYGEGHSFLTALIVPNWAAVRQALAERGENLNGQTSELLAEHPATRAFLQERIDAALVDAANWERVKKIVILTQPFSVAAEELTVSLKLRRNVVLDRHRQRLEDLYK